MPFPYPFAQYTRTSPLDYQPKSNPERNSLPLPWGHALNKDAIDSTQTGK